MYDIEIMPWSNSIKLQSIHVFIEIKRRVFLSSTIIWYLYGKGEFCNWFMPLRINPILVPKTRVRNDNMQSLYLMITRNEYLFDKWFLVMIYLFFILMNKRAWGQVTINWTLGKIKMFYMQVWLVFIMN